MKVSLGLVATLGTAYAQSAPICLQSKVDKSDFKDTQNKVKKAVEAAANRCYGPISQVPDQWHLFQSDGPNPCATACRFLVVSASFSDRLDGGKYLGSDKYKVFRDSALVVEDDMVEVALKGEGRDHKLSKKVHVTYMLYALIAIESGFGLDRYSKYHTQGISKADLKKLKNTESSIIPKDIRDSMPNNDCLMTYLNGLAH
tara:strand:+ start:669 stop:1271 length:603 start_codon:yes stop_codon:yes gene_type:complete